MPPKSELQNRTIDEPRRMDVFEVGYMGRVPSGDDIQSVQEKKGCFLPLSPAFVMHVADLWKGYLNRVDSQTADPQQAYDDITRRGFLGFMANANDNDRRDASRAVEEPILTLTQKGIPLRTKRSTIEGELAMIPAGSGNYVVLGKI